MAIDVEAYYIRYAPMVMRRCRFLLKDEYKAADAMQDVFVKLLDYKDKLKDEYPSSLLYRMATNVCLNVIRSKKNQSNVQLDEELAWIADYDEHAEELEAKDLISKIFKNEKESTKVMAVLHYVDGLTLQEVAKEVNMSVSGVRKRLRLMKERVQKSKLEVK